MDGIDAADFVVALISTNSVRSTWVAKELSVALSKEMRDQKPVVVPLLVGSCPAPTIIVDKYYITINEDQSDFSEIVPGLFRDSFMLDIDLGDALAVNRKALHAALYEFIRSPYSTVRVRINIGDFNGGVARVVAATLEELRTSTLPESQHVIRQVQEHAGVYEIALPIFWATLAEFVSRSVQEMAEQFGRSLDMVAVATTSISNIIAAAMHELALKLHYAVFAYEARKLGQHNLAALIEANEASGADVTRKLVESFAVPSEREFLVAVEAAGNPPDKVISTRFIASIREPEFLLLYAEPSTEILAESWYRLCVPQIVARELIHIAFREGRPLHELKYHVALARGGYGRMGFP
ncbi:MAG: hypothetical protein JWM87_1765 [Candidatus Eremiobacteraeota bacterium]|nr:hypothetical protein [Candidatus Eremiobacteraeota bacterium]